MCLQRRKIRRRAYAAAIAALAIYAVPCVSLAGADSEHKHEYRIKAAFLYNFLKFVEWPQARVDDSNGPVIISTIGKDVFGNALEQLGQKTIEGKRIVVKRFKGIEELKNDNQKQSFEQHPQIEAIGKSHLLFVCPSEKSCVKDILGTVQDYVVLTVGDTEGFVDAGGMINLVTEKRKVRFEVNITTANRAGIRFRSKFLRLAKRIVQQ